MGRLRSVLVVCLVMVLVASLVSGAIIGVSPSILRFNHMLRKGYAQAQMVVSTSNVDPLRAHFEVQGDIKDWVTLEPSNTSFVFSMDKPYQATIVIQPPDDAASGNYTGKLLMTTDSLATVTSGAGSSVIAQVAMLIYIEVTDSQVIACRAGGIGITDAEVGQPFTVRATVFNDGNVRLRPQIKVDIWDQYQTRVIDTKTTYGDQILPTLSLDLVQTVAQDLPLGQYFADIQLPDCGVSKTSTFDVVETGTIADRGELIGVRTNEVALVREPLPMAPMFKNTGPRKVLAQFKGQVMNLKTNKVEKVLESDKLEVNPDETVEFPMFFTPVTVGDYQVSGRVVYNNKITFEESSKAVKVIDNPNGPKISWIFYIIGYFIIGLIILILIGKIRKARRQRRGF